MENRGSGLGRWPSCYIGSWLTYVWSTGGTEYGKKIPPILSSDIISFRGVREVSIHRCHGSYCVVSYLGNTAPANYIRIYHKDKGSSLVDLP